VSQITNENVGRNIIIHLNSQLIERLDALAKQSKKTRASIIRSFLWSNITDEIEQKYQSNKKKEMCK
jgi:predicted DNA-binding protein